MAWVVAAKGSGSYHDVALVCAFVIGVGSWGDGVCRRYGGVGSGVMGHGYGGNMSEYLGLADVAVDEENATLGTVLALGVGKYVVVGVLAQTLLVSEDIAPEGVTVKELSFEVVVDELAGAVVV